MKSTTRPPACCLLLLASACFGQGTAIDVINNSQDWLKLYRLGDPGNTVEVQKRWNQTISLPLVAGGSDNMQMIEVNREGTSITTPETSFQGFDGAFAQNCTLTVSASSISIEYASSSGASSSTNQANSATNADSSAVGGAGGYGGTGGYGGYQAPSKGTTAKPSSQNDAPDSPKPAAQKKNVLAGATGVRVKVARPAASKLPTLEAPSPDITKTNKPDPIPTVASLPPEPPKRNQSGYLIVLGAIAAAVIVFVLAKIRENQRPTANPRFRRAK